MQFSLSTAITTLLAAAALVSAAPGAKAPRDNCDGMAACRAENEAVCSTWDAPWYDACMAVGCEFAPS